jgi:LEA14-like dessication related protein
MARHASVPVHRRAARLTALGAMLCVASFATGCAALAPKLEKPKLEVVGVEILDAQFSQQRFNVKMRVENPNDRELPIRGLRFTMQLAGEEFGAGQSAKAFTVPALGQAEFDVAVTTNLASSLLKILPKLDRNSGALDYRLKGTVDTDLMFLRSIPFDQKGSMSTK